jgi:hypothetical protein
VPDTLEARVTRYCFDEFERMVLSRGEGAPKPTAYVYDGLDRRDRSTVKVGGVDRPQDYAYVGTSKLLSREKTADGDVRSYDYGSQGHRLGQSVKDHDAAPGATPEHRTYATDATGPWRGSRTPTASSGPKTRTPTSTTPTART